MKLKGINMNKFQLILGLSALFIAGCAAFFSVFGIGKLFSGAFIAVVIMASSLEIGKLVTASFLYRYWDKINLLQKVYMAAATIALILITSAGIFGYLSNAYQGATIEFEKQTTALMFKEEQVEQLQEDKEFLLKELDQQVESLPDNYITAKRKLREDYNPQILSINSQLLNLKQEVGELKTELVETGVDVGPAVYLARAFNTDIDTVVKFFMFILIFVFDPLAVMLVVAYNQVLLENRPKKEKTQEENWKDIYSQPILTDDSDKEEKPTKPRKPIDPKKLPKPVIGKGARIPNRSK